MQISDYVAAAVLGSTVLAEVEAAGVEIKAGQPATVSSPEPIGLLRHQYNLSIGWSPSGGVGFSFGNSMLEHVLALTTLVATIAAQGQATLAALQSGAGFSFSAAVSLYGHAGKLSISGTPVAAAPPATA